MTIKARDGAGGTVLEVGGSFDPAEAERLHELLDRIGPEKRVTLDFRAVRLFHDTAVARLARELSEGNRHVALLGLSEHHHRLMRYVGFPTNWTSRSGPARA